MIKRMNKKGEETSGPNVLAGWGLVFITVVVVALILYGTYGYGSSTVTQFKPSDLDRTKLSCEGWVSSQVLKDSYCEYRDIYTNYYISCIDPQVEDAIKKDGYDIPEWTSDCKTEVAKCNELKSSIGANFNAKKYTVNEKICSEWVGTCQSSGGSWKVSCDEGDTDKTDLVSDTEAGKNCCVSSNPSGTEALK